MAATTSDHTSPFDAVSVRHLASRGVDRGWRCLAVHADGPAIPAWLADRVGPTGSVLATGPDVGWAHGHEPFEVLEHDVATEDLPTSMFDLVHARLALGDAPTRDLALYRMVRALRPGGALVVEDLDHMLAPLACPDRGGADERRANRIRDGVLDLLSTRGADLTFGRKLPRLLREHGLVDVAADVFIAFGGPAARHIELDVVDRLGRDVVIHGDVRPEEITDHLAAIGSGHLAVATPALVSAWGRRRSALA